MRHISHQDGKKTSMRVFATQINLHMHVRRTRTYVHCTRARLIDRPRHARGPSA